MSKLGPKKASIPSVLSIHLLGPFRVTVDEHPVEERRWTRRKPKQLIKLLALQPHQQLHREQVMELLWPDLEPEAAANSLHKSIHAARRALEPGLQSGADSQFILTREQQVQLSAPARLWIDVAAFEQAAGAALQSAEAEACEQALLLYAGDLLIEDPYEDWAAAKREQLRGLYLELLARSARLHEERGEFGLSIERLKQALSDDPSNEAAHRHLMRLYALMGNRQQALRQYQQCREALRRELDVEPERATLELHEQIVAGQLLPLAPALKESAGRAASPDQTPPLLKDAAARESLAEPAVETPLSVQPIKAEATPESAPETDAESRTQRPDATEPTPAEEPVDDDGAVQRPPMRSRYAALGVVLALSVLVGLSFYFLKRRNDPIARRGPIDSLAILPLTNGNGDQELEYLSDGITESILNDLAQLPQLKVMARNTVFHYKGREVNAMEVGRELGVRAVLTGQIIKRDDGLVIQVELVDTADGSRLWGGQYNHKLTDIFTVQEEIARSVATELKVKLTGGRLAKSYTVNVEAYELYLKGRYFWQKRSKEGFYKAIDYFEQAVAKDPSYALAYAGLADSYNLLCNYGYAPPTEGMPRAREAAVKALELDPALAEAHASLAWVKGFYDWDASGAETEFRRAIELNPNYVTAHQWYGNLLTAQGRFDEALAELRQAQRIDPNSVMVLTNLGDAFYFMRQYGLAFEHLQRALELDPDNTAPHYTLVSVYEAQGMYAEAAAEYHKIFTLLDNKELAAALGKSFAESGYSGAMRTLRFAALMGLKLGYIDPYYVAHVVFFAGDKEQALEWLERAYQARSAFLIYLKVEPAFESLRPDPRFQNLMRRVGFTS